MVRGDPVLMLSKNVPATLQLDRVFWTEFLRRSGRQDWAAQRVSKKRGLPDRGQSYFLITLAWWCVKAAGATTAPVRCGRGCRWRGALCGCSDVGRYPTAGTRGERSGNPHRGHPRLGGVVADPQLAVTHLCLRTLRNIEMAEHGIHFADCSLPAALCAHALSLLCDLTPMRAVGASYGGAWCPSKLCAYPAVAVARVCPRGAVRPEPHHPRRRRRPRRGTGAARRARTGGPAGACRAQPGPPPGRGQTR